MDGERLRERRRTRGPHRHPRRHGLLLRGLRAPARARPRRGPIVVGMGFEPGETIGAVATASYEARDYGVDSAMAISEALERLPRKIDAVDDPDLDVDTGRLLPAGGHVLLRVRQRRGQGDPPGTRRRRPRGQHRRSVPGRQRRNSLGRGRGVGHTAEIRHRRRGGRRRERRRRSDDERREGRQRPRQARRTRRRRTRGGTGLLRGPPRRRGPRRRARDGRGTRRPRHRDGWRPRRGRPRHAGGPLRRARHGDLPLRPWGDEREVTPRGLPKSLSRESAFVSPTDDADEKRDQVRSLADSVADRATSKDALYQTIGIKVVTPPYDVNTRAHSLRGP